MKTEYEVFDEGFNSSDETLNPYLKGSWAHDAWQSGYDSKHNKNSRDYQKEFANKLVKYRTALSNYYAAINEYKNAFDEFNTAAECYEKDAPFVISCDGELSNGWLVQPFNYKLKVELDAHTVTPLKDTLRNEPFENC